MHKWNWQTTADKHTHVSALVGCVSSGDLEIVFIPAYTGVLEVDVCTTVGGQQERWNQLLERFLISRVIPSGKMRINDCGATPGVIHLRLEQLLEKL